MEEMDGEMIPIAIDEYSHIPNTATMNVKQRLGGRKSSRFLHLTLDLWSQGASETQRPKAMAADSKHNQEPCR